MSDYTIRVEASTDEAEKKLKRVDDKVRHLEKGGTINITLPNLNQTVSGLNTIARTTATVAKQALDISRALNIGPGAVINDIDQVFGMVKKKGEQTLSLMQLLSKATPQNILGSTFNVASDSATSLAKNVSNIGYEIFGLTQSVNILKQAFGSLFDDTIGREIRLQETLLRTRTTLVSTAKIVSNGSEITDPYKALIALEAPIEKTLENIRRRSLDIAGTTSDAIIQVFGIVASQVGTFGGNLKDAEDLAISFAGALGTMGISDPMYANQEIRSILSGTIDQNSILARSLGITNEEISRAKRSSEGLVSYLTKRLEAFAAGQKIAAQGFAGIVSNIQEVREEAARSLGKHLLQPLLESLTTVYTRLQLVFKEILSIADGIGRIGALTVNTVLGGVKAAPIVQKFDERDQLNLFRNVDQQVAKASLGIQKALYEIRPIISRITNEILTAFTLIGSGIIELAKGFAYFKYEQIRLMALSFTTLAQILNASVVPALSAVLNLYGQVLSLPAFNFISQVSTQMQLLEKVGVLPLVRLLYYLGSFTASFRTVYGWIATGVAVIKKSITTIISLVANGIETVTANVSRVSLGTLKVIEQVLGKIILLVIRTARQLGILLTEIAVYIATLSPHLAGLSIALTDIGRALRDTEKHALNAAKGLDKFAAASRAKFAEVAVAGQKAAQATRTLGATITTQLGAQLVKGARAIGSFIVGLIRFQLTLLAIETVISALPAIWANFTRAARDTAEAVKSAEAIKRLATSYKDLGENASAAAKAIRDADLASLGERETKIKARLVELQPQVIAAGKAADKALAEAQARQKELERIQASEIKLGARPATTSKAPRFDADLAQAQTRSKQLRSEYAKLARELQQIQDIQNKEQQRQKEADDVQVLGKERKDIELAVGELRKELERELRDERFRTAREVASLEQSLREEARKSERAELDRRLADEARGLTGNRAELAQILGDYERGLFDAQTEAQRRQFELAEQRQNLEKSLADYKIKTEEQAAKLQKRLGAYNVQVQDYLAAKQKRSDAERLQNEMRIAALRTDGVVFTSKEKEVFKNTAARLGYSATGILAHLREPGVMQDVGSPTGRMNSVEDLLPWMKSLRVLFPPAVLDPKKARRAMGRRGAAFYRSTEYGEAIYDNAAADLGSPRFNEPLPPEPKKLAPFTGLDQELSKLSAERRDLGESIMALRETLNDLFKDNATNALTQKTFDALMNKDYSGLPSIIELSDEAAKSASRLTLLRKTLAEGKRSVDPLTAALTELDIVVSQSMESFIELTTKFQKRRNRSFDAAKTTKVISTNYEFFKTGSIPELEASIAEMRKVVEKTTDMSLAFQIGILESVLRVRKAVPLQTEIRLHETIGALSTAISEIPDQTKQQKLGLIDETARAAFADDPVKLRLYEAEMRILQKRQELEKDPNANQEIIKQQLDELATALRNSAIEVGNFENQLRKTIERIALLKEVAQTFREGFKNVVDTVLNNGDITGAVNELLNSVKNKITGYVLDIATRPLQDAMESGLLRFFKLDSPEEIVAKNRQAILDKVTAVSLDLDRERNKTLEQIAANTATPTAISAATPEVTLTAPGGSPTNTTLIPVDPCTQSLTAPIEPAIANVGTEAQKASDNLRNITNSTVNTPQQLSNFQKGLGGFTTALGGITMAISGAQQMKQGGTHNTLMGLASIFGSVASLGSMFIPGGLFGKALPGRALGGDIRPNTPYLVGESGPELILPETGGTVFSNSRSRQLLSTLSDKNNTLAANQQRSANPSPRNLQITHTYQAEVINNVEYVTADQFRKGMAESSERGKLLTIQALQNSVGTRRRLAL